MGRMQARGPFGRCRWRRFGRASGHLLMDIRIINLERSADRRESARRQIASLGITASFSTGVDGAAIDPGRYRAFLPPANRFFRRPLTPGEIGCFASHYRLWQECVAAGRPMLILEDDFRMESDVPAVIDLLPALLNRHRCVRLAGLLPRKSRKIATLPGGRSVVLFDKGPQGAGAYALAPAAAAILLAHAATWHEPVDNYMDSFWIHGLLPIGVTPYPVFFVRGGSLIEASRFDRGAGLVRYTRRAARIPQTARRLAFKMGPAWRSA